MPVKKVAKISHAGLGSFVNDDGSLYIMSAVPPQIMIMTPDKQISHFAGIDARIGMPAIDGPLATARFRFPLGIAKGLDGTLYVADANYIRVIKDGQVTTLAGHHITRGDPDYGLHTDGVGKDASISRAEDIWVEPDGRLLFWDEDVLREVKTDGTVTTIPGEFKEHNEKYKLHQATDESGNRYYKQDLSNHPCEEGAFIRQSPDGKEECIDFPAVNRGFWPDTFAYDLKNKILYFTNSTGIWEYTPEEIDVKPTEMWKGYTENDVRLLHDVFEKPSDISLCPFCLNYAERVDGCMYMTHTCEKARRHEALYNRMKDSGTGKVEWCTLCGRPSRKHRHFRLALPTNPSFEFADVVPTDQGQFRFFDTDCKASGGGGHEEKIRRFNRLLQYSCELQGEVGKIPEKEALTELVEEMWIAALSRNRAVPRIIESKRFDFPCAFPEDAAVVTRPDEVDHPDVPRPAEEKELTPVKHETPDNECVAELGPHEDKRPVYQFRHKQANGSIYEHKNEYVCGEDLEAMIRANIFTGLCPMNPDKCKAKLYPEEVKGIVSDEYYEVYRKNFNRVNAAAVGGSSSTGMFRPVQDGECALPPKTAGKRRKTYRKNKKQVKKTRAKKRV